jgi:hypothetical protein
MCNSCTPSDRATNGSSRSLPHTTQNGSSAVIHGRVVVTDRNLLFHATRVIIAPRLRENLFSAMFISTALYADEGRRQVLTSAFLTASAGQATAPLLHEPDGIMLGAALLNGRTGNAAGTQTGDNEIPPHERMPPRQLWTPRGRTT